MSTIWRTGVKVVKLPAVLPPGKLELQGSKVSSGKNVSGAGAGAGSDGENDAGKLRSARGESVKLAKTFYHELIAGRR